MPILKRGYCKAGAVVELGVRVAAGCTASRQSGGREGLDADCFLTHDSRPGRVQLVPEALEQPRVGRKSTPLREHGNPILYARPPGDVLHFWTVDDRGRRTTTKDALARLLSARPDADR